MSSCGQRLPNYITCIEKRYPGLFLQPTNNLFAYPTSSKEESIWGRLLLGAIHNGTASVRDPALITQPKATSYKVRLSVLSPHVTRTFAERNFGLRMVENLEPVVLDVPWCPDRRWSGFVLFDAVPRHLTS